MEDFKNLEEFSLAVGALQQEEEFGIEKESIASKRDVMCYVRNRLDFNRITWEISDDVWKQFVFIMNITTTPSKRHYNRRFNPSRLNINLNGVLKKIPNDPACADLVMENKSLVLGWLEHLWQNGGMPDCWKECKLMPIYNGTSDEDAYDAYVPVLVPNYVYHVWNSVLVVKLDNEIKKHKILSTGQGHYASWVTVKDLIFMLDYIIERKISKKGGEIYVFFAKIKSFRETMNRDKLFEKLHKLPIDKCLVSRIEELYEETIVTHNGQKFWSNSGLNRSLNLTSLLVDVYLYDLDSFLSNNPAGPFKLDQLKLSLVGQHTSVAVLAENAEHLDLLMERFDAYLTREQLMLDYEKSRVVRFSKDGNATPEKRWKLGDLMVDSADSYEWNRHMFETTGKHDMAIENARKIAEKYLEVITELDASVVQSLFDDPMDLFDDFVLKRMRGIEVWGREVGNRLDDLQVRYARWVMDLDESMPEEKVLRTVHRRPLSLWFSNQCDKYFEKLEKCSYGSCLNRIFMQMKAKSLYTGPSSAGGRASSGLNGNFSRLQLSPQSGRGRAGSGLNFNRRLLPTSSARGRAGLGQNSNRHRLPTYFSQP